MIWYRNKTSLEMGKAELLAYLTDEEATGLAAHPLWQLRDKLTNWVFAGFTYFMLDLHEQLATLSKSYQSNSLVVFDVSRNLNKTLRALDKLKSTPGREEAKFHTAVAEHEGANCLSTCQLYDPDQSQLTNERTDIIDSLDKFLIERFQKTLEDPILDATASSALAAR